MGALGCLPNHCNEAKAIFTKVDRNLACSPQDTLAVIRNQPSPIIIIMVILVSSGCRESVQFYSKRAES